MDQGGILIPADESLLKETVFDTEPKKMGHCIDVNFAKKDKYRLEQKKVLFC